MSKEIRRGDIYIILKTIGGILLLLLLLYSLTIALKRTPNMVPANERGWINRAKL